MPQAIFSLGLAFRSSGTETGRLIVTRFHPPPSLPKDWGARHYNRARPLGAAGEVSTGDLVTIKLRGGEDLCFTYAREYQNWPDLASIALRRDLANRCSIH